MCCSFLFIFIDRSLRRLFSRFSRRSLFFSFHFSPSASDSLCDFFSCRTNFRARTPFPSSFSSFPPDVRPRRSGTRRCSTGPSGSRQRGAGAGTLRAAVAHARRTVRARAGWNGAARTAEQAGAGTGAWHGALDFGQRARRGGGVAGIGARDWRRWQRQRQWRSRFPSSHSDGGRRVGRPLGS